MRQVFKTLDVNPGRDPRVVYCLDLNDPTGTEVLLPDVVMRAIDAPNIVATAIDRAFEHHMRQLFLKMATQMEGAHSDVARAAFRKQLRAALDARSEMLAIAKETT